MPVTRSSVSCVLPFCIALALLGACETNDDVRPLEATHHVAVATGADESQADRTLSDQMRKALADDPKMSSSAKNVDIEVRKGMVTLRGSVISLTEKAGVLATALTIAGPNKVIDELTVAM